MKTLYRAARVHTLGHPRTGEWVLVDGRHVQRVGSGEVPAADRTVDLPGTTIVPGLIDAHVHLTSTGLSLADRDVHETTSRDELLALVAARAGAEEPTVTLGGFDESRWADPRLPSIVELDRVTERPLTIRRADGHLWLANTAALTSSRLLGMDGVGMQDGAPTGVVTGPAGTRLARWVGGSLGPSRIEEAQLAAASLAASRGVTCVHEMSMPEGSGELDLEVFIGHRARLPVDSALLVATMDVPRAVELGLPAIGGDLAIDGSIGARTAALTSPYADTEGKGRTYYADDEVTGFFRDAHEAGLQVGMHAIGDRAIELLLQAWERVYRELDSRQRRHFRARRHRIEHAEMATATQIERAAVLGLAMSVQPAFDGAWGGAGGLYERALGPERSRGMNAFRTMLERGLVVGAGSDAPVTPLDPWGGVAAMMNHHDDAQRLSKVEALRVHTAGSARLAFLDEKKGTLEPGFHADLAAYEDDPLDAPEVAELRPVLTVSLGREVFAR